jgi:hypothetical protein
MSMTEIDKISKLSMTRSIRDLDKWKRPSKIRWQKLYTFAKTFDCQGQAWLSSRKAQSSFRCRRSSTSRRNLRMSKLCNESSKRNQNKRKHAESMMNVIEYNFQSREICMHMIHLAQEDIPLLPAFQTEIWTAEYCIWKTMRSKELEMSLGKEAKGDTSMG